MQKIFQIPPSVSSGSHVFRDLADAFLRLALSVVTCLVNLIGITSELVLTNKKSIHSDTTEISVLGNRERYLIRMTEGLTDEV